MTRTIRDGFGEGLVALGETQERVLVLAADLMGSVRATKFQKRWPKRTYEMGICEQNMMGVAAGLAHEGYIPFACSFAAFNPGRNWDQLRVSVCYSNNNVKIVGSHAGVSVGEDGATHQALEDLAITQALPGLTVIVPCDANQAKEATIAAAKHEGPVYLRLSRAGSKEVASPAFKIGQADVLCTGTDVTIIATGLLVAEALEAAERLEEQGISAEVINYSTIKPFDEETLLRSVEKTRAVVSAEEHQLIGGLGMRAAQILATRRPAPMEQVGMQDAFGQSGTAQELLEKYGMTSEDVVKAAQRVMKRK